MNCWFKALGIGVIAGVLLGLSLAFALMALDDDCWHPMTRIKSDQIDLTACLEMHANRKDFCK